MYLKELKESETSSFVLRLQGMRASDKDFSVSLHVDQGNLEDIQLDSDTHASISIAIKISLWLTTHTKLNRSKNNHQLKKQKHTDR